MKRIIYILLLLTLCFTLVACDEYIVDDSDGKDGFWDWLNKEVEEYEFEMNADQKSYRLVKYNYLSPDASTIVNIPSTYNNLPVTQIGNQAFYACEQIEKVVIPDTIISIGSYAFFHCDNLTEINIPSGLIQIREYAFEGCDLLTEISIPHSVNIGFRAFCECENLKTVVIGNEKNGTSYVDGYAFYKCTKLENAKLEGVTTIDSHAFAYCESLTSVFLSNSLTKIGSSAFEYCENLKYVYFNGTTDQWKNVDTLPWWDKGAGDFEVKYGQ